MPDPDPQPVYAASDGVDLEDLARAPHDGWEGDLESEIFLEPEYEEPVRLAPARPEAARADSLSPDRARIVRPMPDPRPAPSGRDYEREWDAERVVPFPGRRDSGLEPRLGKHHPLDKPTFMRKRMD
jgi:hypothetical protein